MGGYGCTSTTWILGSVKSNIILNLQSSTPVAEIVELSQEALQSTQNYLSVPA